MKWLYLFLAIIGEVVATSSLKDAHGFTKIVPLIVVMVGYSVTFFFLSLTFKEMSIGIVYAIWSGVGIVFITAIGYYRYGEKMDTPALVGMGFIIVGIVIMNAFSKSVSH